MKATFDLPAIREAGKPLNDWDDFTPEKFAAGMLATMQRTNATTSRLEWEGDFKGVPVRAGVLVKRQGDQLTMKPINVLWFLVAYAVAFKPCMSIRYMARYPFDAGIRREVLKSIQCLCWSNMPPFVFDQPEFEAVPQVGEES